MGGSVYRDSKTCIYPYEDADPRDASAFASAGVDETTRGKREKGSAVSTPLWMRDWKGFLWWPLMQKRRNADGASDLEALDGTFGWGCFWFGECLPVSALRLFPMHGRWRVADRSTSGKKRGRPLRLLLFEDSG